MYLYRYIKLFHLCLILQSCCALYTDDKNVIELGPKNFEELVIKGDEVWIVEFYAPWCGFCQNLIPEYTKLAKMVKGILKVGAINVDEYRELAAQYNVRGLPTIKIFGVDKQKPEDYTGGKTAKEIMETAMRAAKDQIIGKLDLREQESLLKESLSEFVVDLDDKTFDETVLESENMWMVMFYAPWCGYCRKLEPQWALAAKELTDKVNFGKLDCTANKVKSKEYSITGYPTVKLFIPGETPLNYEGGRRSKDIVAWAIEKQEENTAVPQVYQIIEETQLIQECEHKKLSIIAFLPNILDCQKVCRNSYIAIIKNLAEKYKKNKWCWLWSEALAQPEIEKALHIGGSGYPALVAVNHQNRSYSTFVGAFTEDKIYDFLFKFYVGKGTKVSIEVKEFPKIFDIEPWNGKDKPVPQLEEKSEL